MMAVKCNEGWKPLWITKSGWSMNIKSMQDEDCGIRWVGWGS